MTRDDLEREIVAENKDGRVIIIKTDARISLGNEELRDAVVFVRLGDEQVIVMDTEDFIREYEVVR